MAQEMEKYIGDEKERNHGGGGNGMIQTIPAEVAKKLGWYVYRLIDPRNGETFYVGKGQKNRLFEHVNLALMKNSGDDAEDAQDLKSQRIKEIHSAGLAVGHVIHRHGIESEKMALQIEAAVMDAYPGLANRAGGHDSGDYGCRHVKEIIDEYSATEFEVSDRLILISINKSFDEEGKSVYDAVRGIWRISMSRAQSYSLVLAHRKGVVIGAFFPRRWLPATPESFPWLSEPVPTRIGFEGVAADKDTWDRYVGRRVPERFRARGAAFPVRFIDPEGNVMVLRW